MYQFENIKAGLRKSAASAVLILKLVIPFYILADILLYFDLLRPVSRIFSPLTALLHLPPESAMAITAGVLLNIYAAVAFAAPLGLSGYQWTILGVFLGVCHSLPVENVIMKKLGISFIYSTILRIVMAFVTTMPILFLPPDLFAEGHYSGTVKIAVYDSFSGLMLSSIWHAAVLSGKIIVLITIVTIVMDALKGSRFIGLCNDRLQTSFSIITGQLLGITYGAGILFQEAESGNLRKKDIFFIGTFLMICHSILEDPLLFVIFGADYWIIVVSRLSMAAIVATLLVRIVKFPE